MKLINCSSRPSGKIKPSQHHRLVTQDMVEKFVAVVHDHQSDMFRVAKSIMHNLWDAEDAVSDAIEKAWRAVDTLRDWNSARSWLLSITWRCCITSLRKQRREIPMPETDLQFISGFCHNESPLWMYLETLRPGYQVVMQLRYEEGLSIDEIASTLCIPLGTVSSRIHRALKQLRPIFHTI